MENPVLGQSYSSEAPHGRGIPAADDVTSQAHAEAEVRAAAAASFLRRFELGSPWNAALGDALFPHIILELFSDLEMQDAVQYVAVLLFLYSFNF